MVTHNVHYLFKAIPNGDAYHEVRGRTRKLVELADIFVDLQKRGEAEATLKNYTRAESFYNAASSIITICHDEIHQIKYEIDKVKGQPLPRERG